MSDEEDPPRWVDELVPEVNRYLKELGKLYSEGWPFDEAESVRLKIWKDSLLRRIHADRDRLPALPEF